jgi:DNA-binding transcriptional ArsR family regulator
MSTIRPGSPRARPLRASSTRAPLCVPAIVNLVVQYQQELDRTLAAIADPTRRGILERLGEGNATITELAEPIRMSLTGLKKHIRVLEDAELVTTEKVGRARQCSLGPRHLEDLQRWIETYRRMLDERLDRLGELLDGTKGQTR